MTTATVPISALIATIRGWPDTRHAVSLIAPQVPAAGGEFIVADGSGREPPSAAELTELGPVRWLSLPGRSVFQLRLAGYRAAKGEVIAITEDHVYVEPNWIARILEIHRGIRRPARSAARS